MKKKIWIALAGALAAAVLLGGCGKNGRNGSGSSAGSEQEVEYTTEELMQATDYNVEDCVTLNEYNGMTIELTGTYEVTEDDVKAYAEQVLSMYPAYEKTDKKTVKDGNIVNIDYEGKIDGEAFDGGSAQGSHLEIGSNTFIDGFEEGLIGKKVGETVDLNLKFPDDYGSEELAGKDAVFTVTINGIEKKKSLTYDTLTDDYTNDNFGTDVAGFKDQVRQVLESQSEQSRESEIQSRVLEKLDAECAVVFPDGLVNERMTEYMDRVRAQLEEEGQTFEEAVGVSEEEYRKEMQSQMEQSLKEEMILEAIVLQEGITITESEYSAMLQNYMSAMGIATEEEFYEQYGEKDYTRLGFAENKALSQILENVNVTEANQPPAGGSGDSGASQD